MPTNYPAGRRLEKAFRDIAEQDVREALAQTMRENFHAKTQHQILSPPVADWCRVLALANPLIIFDFAVHKVFVAEQDLPALQALIQTHLVDRTQAEGLDEE